MRIIKLITNYLHSAKAELEKVSWPSRQETLRYSALVMSVSVVLAIFFAALDFGLSKVVDVALTKRNGQTTEPATPAPQPDVQVAPVEIVTSTPSETPKLDFGDTESKQ